MARQSFKVAPDHWRVALFDLARGIHMAGEPLHTLAVAVAHGGYSGSNADGAASYVAAVEIPAGAVNAARSVRAIGSGVEGALRTLVSELAPFMVELIPPQCASRWETTQMMREIDDLTDGDREMDADALMVALERVNHIAAVYLEPVL